MSPVSIRGTGATRRKQGVEPATLEEPRVAWCALNYGELAEIRRKDIDMAAGEIQVRRTVSFTPGGATVGPPKTDAGIRDVAIPPHLHDSVRAHPRDHVKSA